MKMKKGFAVLLVSLMLISCFGSTFAEGEVMEKVTFDMFYSEYGIPYEGEWVCYDNSLYLYLPTALEKVELNSEMQADGVLAIYSDTNEQGDNLEIQITKQGKKESMETILREFDGVSSYVGCIEINGIPVAGALIDDNTLYLEALLDSGDTYGIQMYISDAAQEETSMQAMYAFGIVYSIATAELEIDKEKVNFVASQMQQEEEAVREEVSVRISSEVRIQFEYNDGNEEDLDQLNQMLAAMDLTDVDVEDLSVYLCKTQDIDHGVVVDTTYRCGLNDGILVCKKAAFEKTYRYQIATEVFEADAIEEEAFANYWCEKYPERRVSTITTYDFDTYTGAVVVYFEEIAK